MIQRILLLSLVLTQVAASNASSNTTQSSPPPPPETSGWQTWEISLAAGSGGVALVLLLYACMMRPRKKKEEVADVEAGKKKQANGQKKPDAKAGTSTSQVKVLVDKKGERVGPVTKAPAAKAVAAKVTAPVEPKSMPGKMLAAVSLKKAKPPSPPPKPVERKVRSLPPVRKGSM
jgi:hypothetical protein